jgi:hypothetical protein
LKPCNTCGVKLPAGTTWKQHNEECKKARREADRNKQEKRDNGTHQGSQRKKSDNLKQFVGPVAVALAAAPIPVAPVAASAPKPASTTSVATAVTTIVSPVATGAASAASGGGPPTSGPPVSKAKDGPKTDPTGYENARTPEWPWTRDVNVAWWRIDVWGPPVLEALCGLSSLLLATKLYPRSSVVEEVVSTISIDVVAQRPHGLVEAFQARADALVDRVVSRVNISVKNIHAHVIPVVERVGEMREFHFPTVAESKTLLRRFMDLEFYKGVFRSSLSTLGSAYNRLRQAVPEYYKHVGRSTVYLTVLVLAVVGSVLLAHGAYRLFNLGAWRPRIQPRSFSRLPAAPLKGFLTDARTVRVDSKNAMSIYRYVYNCYESHCVKLDTYLCEADILKWRREYIDARDEIVEAVYHNMMWFDDIHDDGLLSNYHLNYLGKGVWEPP